MKTEDIDKLREGFDAISSFKLYTALSLKSRKIIFDYFLPYLHKVEPNKEVEFIEWTGDNSWFKSSNDLWYCKSDGNPDEGITGKQLFEQFEQFLTERK